MNRSHMTESAGASGCVRLFILTSCEHETAPQRHHIQAGCTLPTTAQVCARGRVPHKRWRILACLTWLPAFYAPHTDGRRDRLWACPCAWGSRGDARQACHHQSSSAQGTHTYMQGKGSSRGEEWQRQLIKMCNCKLCKPTREVWGGGWRAGSKDMAMCK